MSKPISVAVIGRSLTQEERTQLRSASSHPLSIVTELPNDPQSLEQLQRLRPQATLVMLNGDLPRSFEMIERINHEIPETAIVCSSEHDSSDVILQSFRAGAAEFLRLPLTDEEIEAVFTKLHQTRLRTADESHQGRIIAVFSSKGGCGTTFVAANLAVSLARLSRKRTCIVDLNLQAGDQPTYLGLEHTPYTIYDIVRNFDRLDEQFLASHLVQRSKNLSLLAAPSEIGGDEDIRAEHITQILTMLRSQFEYVVIDPQHTLSEITISALDLADDLLLLLTLDIPSIRSAKRALDIFTRLGYDRKRIKIVLNRYTKTPEFEKEQIEKVLEERVYAVLSNDYRAAISSINVGEPLVQSNRQSRLVREFSHLAGKLSGVHTSEEHVAASTRGWSVIFGRK
ncbi:MAG TPA: AAA family ATPase [Blastocatellia bacterium]|nr:AAA family ATPase [Blastocatellia bacterium]